MIAVILAGGKGKRLEKLTQNIPKPLLKIGGKPNLEHHIDLLKTYGIKDIWILSGYLGNKIKDYFGNGEKWGVKIYHIIEQEPLGTAGAIKQLEGEIKGNFLVLSGDVVLDIEIKSLITFHKKHNDSVATIIVHPNDHPWDSDLVEVNSQNQVISFIVRRGKTHPKDLLFRNLTNASVFILNPKLFEFIKKGEICDLEKDIFPQVLKSNGKIFAYNTSEYIKDMGTVERLKKVRRDFMSGKIARLNLKNKRGAIFLDRDGVINQEVDQLSNHQDFKLYPFAADAIKKINCSDYLAIIVTNQPMIAKGFMTISSLDFIHKKLETELGWLGAKIDGIYYCPHHPERGFREEIKELKIKCNCRKPKTGLIKKAVRDFNIDLSRSFLIGDSTLDAKTAEEAGAKFIGVRTGYSVSDKKYKVRNFKMAKNLFSAVNYILN